MSVGTHRQAPTRAPHEPESRATPFRWPAMSLTLEMASEVAGALADERCERDDGERREDKDGDSARSCGRSVPQTAAERSPESARLRPTARSLTRVTGFLYALRLSQHRLVDEHLAP